MGGPPPPGMEDWQRHGYPPPGQVSFGLRGVNLFLVRVPVSGSARPCVSVRVCGLGTLSYPSRYTHLCVCIYFRIGMRKMHARGDPRAGSELKSAYWWD